MTGKSTQRTTVTLVTVSAWYSSGDIGKAIVFFKATGKEDGATEPIAVSERPPIDAMPSEPCKVVYVRLPAGYKRGFALLQTTVGDQMHYCVAEWNRSYTKIMPNKLIVEDPESTLTLAWIATKIKESWPLFS